MFENLVYSRSITQRLWDCIFMRSNDKHSYHASKSHHSTKSILFGHHAHGNECPRPEPKSKEINEEGWGEFAVLGLGLLMLPSLMFS